MSNQQLNLIREYFKNQLEDIGTLQIKIKYDKDIIITDNVINDTYHRIYNNTHDEDTIIDTLNSLDINITAYYDTKPMYLFIKINNAVNTLDTYCFNLMMDNLKEKYEIVVNTLLKLYVDSLNRSNKNENY